MGRWAWRLIMLLTLASLRRQALVASVAKARPPASCFVAPAWLPRPRGLHGAPMPIRPLGLRTPTGPVLAAAHAAARTAAAGRRAAPPRAAPPPLAALRMDSEVEPLSDGQASHFFASLTPNRAPASAIGSTRLRLDRSMTLLEQHLAEEQLQQDWVHADPATAFFLALTLQMEFQGILDSSPAGAAQGGLDLTEHADRLAEKVVEHLAAHPELRVSPITASASAAAAAATAGSSAWRRAVEDDSGGSMVGDGIMSAAAHLLEVDLVKLSVTVEGLVETIFPPPQGVASRGTLVVVSVGAVVWSTSPLGSGSVRNQARLAREAGSFEGDAAAAAAAAVAAGEQEDAARASVVAGSGASGWVSQEAITDEVSLLTGTAADGDTATNTHAHKSLYAKGRVECACAHARPSMYKNAHTHTLSLSLSLSLFHTHTHTHTHTALRTAY